MLIDSGAVDKGAIRPRLPSGVLRGQSIAAAAAASGKVASIVTGNGVVVVTSPAASPAGAAAVAGAAPSSDRGPSASSAAASSASSSSSSSSTMEAGEVCGSLGAEPCALSLYAGLGVTAYRLPRRAALVILAPTHELIKGRLTPRASPYHLRRPPPPPPPFERLNVAALLGEGGASRVLLVRQRPDEHGASLEQGANLAQGASLASACSSGRDGGAPATAAAVGGCEYAKPSKSSSPLGGCEYALKVYTAAGGRGRAGGGGGVRAGSSGSIVEGTLAQQAARERLALSACTHQFVPRLAGACPGYTLMEAVRGCELFYLLREVRRFEPSTAAFYSAMVLSALTHLHGHAIVHRDLKPENLVLDGEGSKSVCMYVCMLVCM